MNFKFLFVFTFFSVFIAYQAFAKVALSRNKLGKKHYYGKSTFYASMQKVCSKTVGFIFKSFEL